MTDWFTWPLPEEPVDDNAPAFVLVVDMAACDQRTPLERWFYNYRLDLHCPFASRYEMLTIEVREFTSSRGRTSVTYFGRIEEEGGEVPPRIVRFEINAPPPPTLFLPAQEKHASPFHMYMKDLPDSRFRIRREDLITPIYSDYNGTFSNRRALMLDFRWIEARAADATWIPKQRLVSIDSHALDALHYVLSHPPTGRITAPRPAAPPPKRNQ